ncbi:MAG: gliding motility-associated C-terminal domain-containing protein [Flavobacteriales bacterium]
MPKQLLLLFIGLAFAVTLAAQNSCPSIDAGDDLVVDCDNPCATLSADVFETESTDTYTVESIPYALPFPLNGGTSLFIGIDDTWSDAIDLPFEFCFFGINYNQIVVGSNGIITFDAGEANGYCPWAFDDNAPSANLPTNAIFAPFMDINPASCGDVRYQLLGTAPCRTFVVNYDGVCLYSCSSTQVDAQIVFYETTNVIETYIGNKPACGGWNSGNTLVGIQNNSGTVAYVPPGRNTGNWSASNEAWRFNPSGAPLYTINWYKSGYLVGTGNGLEVCPTDDATYTGEIVYDGCGGSISLTDDVNVTVEGVISDDNDPEIQSENLFLCSSAELTNVEVLNPGGELSSDCNCLVDFQVDPALATPGIYTITHTMEGDCGPITDSISLEIEQEIDPTIVQPENVCSSVEEINIETLSNNGVFEASCATCIDSLSGVFLPNAAGVGTYTISYSFAGYCPSSSSVELIVDEQSDATFSLQNFACSSSPIANATPLENNGTWSASCTDCIDQTGEIDFSSATNDTYTITYSIDDECPNETSLNIDYLVEVNPTFNLVGTACESDGAFDLSPEEAGGTWTSNCGSCVTGDQFVPQNAGAGNYTLSYSFDGLCPTNSSNSITVSNQLSAVFTDLPNMCTNDLSVQISPSDPGGVFSATCGNCLNQFGEFSPSTAGPGIHTLTYEISGSCGDIHTSEVSVEQSLDATIVDPGSFCLGYGEVQLVAAEAGGVWSASCGTCIDSDSGVFNTLDAGVGSYTVSYELFGFCGDTDNSTIAVTPNTASNFTVPASLCVNNDATTLLPQNPNCSQCLNNSGTFNPQTAGVGLHEITYTISGVCGTSTSQLIQVNGLPNAHFALSTYEGCAPLNVIGEPEQVGVQCFWNFGEVASSESCTNPNYTFASPGCYDIEHTIIDGNGCINSYNIENAICVFSNPESGFTFGPENPTTDEPFIQVYETAPQSNLLFEWTLDGEFINADSTAYMDLSLFGGSSAPICLTVIDQNNCFNVECKDIDVIQNLELFIPNAFTPNGDNINDIWSPKVLGTVQYELFVFNRWGEIVFYSTDPSEYWNGSFNGSEHFAQDGMYHYRLKIVGQDYEAEDYSGFVILSR